MGLPVFKDCCCLELKWGALIVAIVDIFLSAAAVGQSSHFNMSGYGWMGYIHDSYYVWIVAVIVHVVHIVACVLVIVSVFKPNKKLVIMYLITGIIRIIYDLIFIIYICVELWVVGPYLITVIMLAISICLGVYFWFVIYSWYRKLGGSTPAD